MWPRGKKRKGIQPGSIHKHIKSLIFNAGSRIISFLENWSGRIRRKHIISRMEKGDIILASPGILSLSPISLMFRLFLKSRYVHTMLYIGHGKIIHTTTRHGVIISKVPRGIYRRNRYAVFRVLDLSPEQKELIVNEALKWKGKKLDHAGLITSVPGRLLGFKRTLISWEKNRTWCSKLAYQAYSACGIELVPPEKAGTITSEDLAHLPGVKRI